VGANPRVSLIVGCQRSGSTLLESIFNAHPSVRVIGEENNVAYEYFLNPAKLSALPEDAVCLRIPMATHRLQHAVDQFAGARVLFMLRDPRDVVVSMRELKVGNDNWLVRGAHHEIRKSVQNLPDRQRQEERLEQLYDEIADLSDVRFGGFCWAVKNRFIPMYLNSPLPTRLVRYEVLTAQPEPYLRQICEYLRLEWSDRLLEHQNHSAGQFAGTNKGEAIHQRSIRAYKSKLTLEDRRKLHSVIRPDMEMLGYVELFD
jgi:protein-tyrosine sulfotransferase